MLRHIKPYRGASTVSEYQSAEAMDSTIMRHDLPPPMRYLRSAQKTDLTLQKNREKTFVNWPRINERTDDMTYNGFYYTQNKDTIKCAYCGLELSGTGYNIAYEHKRRSIDCQFHQIKSRAIDDINVIPVHDGMINVRDRIATFDGQTIKTSISELAEAGFFYDDTRKSVRCFHCDCHVQNWTQDSNVWHEHAIHGPKCLYLNANKSIKYVQNALIEARRLVLTNQLPHRTKMCIICYDSQRDVMFYPCGHVISCKRCARGITTCYMCRKDVIDITAFYFS